MTVAPRNAAPGGLFRRSVLDLYIRWSHDGRMDSANTSRNERRGLKDEQSAHGVRLEDDHVRPRVRWFGTSNERRAGAKLDIATERA